MRFKSLFLSGVFSAGVLAGVTLNAPSAFAQTAATATISGTVTDQTGAAVSGVTVQVINLDTGAVRNVTTTGSGAYTAAFLAPGRYEVILGGGNFGKVDRKNITLSVGQNIPVDAALPAASVTQEVTVTDATPLIEADKTSVSQVISEQIVSGLPVVSRRFDNFALLSANTVPDGGSGLISFHGISGLYNQTYVDGANNTEMLFSEARGRASGSPYLYSLEAIKEFQVETATYSAEFGQSAGGQVNAVTKSGTNKLHGDLFYFLRYPSMNALDPYNKYRGISTNNPLLLTQPLHQQQQFGVAVGGPIIKDKLFGFFVYDGFRRVNPILYSSTANISLTPSGTSASTDRITPTQCTGITSAQCTNAINYLLALSGSYPRTGKQDIFFPRLDYILNDRNHIFVDFNFNNWHSPSSYASSPSYTNSSITTNGSADFHERFLIGQWTWQVSDRSVNELRLQWGRDLETNGANGPAPSVTIGNVQTYGMPNALPRAAEPDEHRNQITDVFSTTHGKHTIKAGGDINLVHEVMINLYQGGGLYSYNKSTVTGNFQGWSQDFFRGSASTGAAGGHYDTFVQTIDPITGVGKDDFWMKMFDGFVEDTWKLTSKLTFNLGVRYDIQLTPAPLKPNTSSALATQYNSTIKNVTNRVQPRIGIAWSPYEGTVFRAAYGLFSALNQGSTYYAMRVENGVFQTNYSFNGLGLAGTGTLATGAPRFPDVIALAGTSLPFPGPPLNSKPTYGPDPADYGGTPSSVETISLAPAPSFHGLDPNFVPPLAHQMQLGVEQALPGHMSLSIGYVGTRATRLPVFVDANIIGKTPSGSKTYLRPDGTAFTLPVYLPSDRRDPSITNLNTGFSAVNSWYHSMAVTFKKPFSHGVEVLINHTWSKAIDSGQVPGQYGTFYGTDAPLDPNNLKLERSISDLDMRNRFTGTVVYKPELFKSNKWLDQVVDKWMLSLTATESSALPVTAGLTGYPSGAAAGGLYGGLISSGSGLATNGRAPNQLVGRNAFHGRGLHTIDMRITRDFPLYKEVKFQVGADAFNVMNHSLAQSFYSSRYQLASGCSMANSNPCQINYATGTPFLSTTSTSSLLYGARQMEFRAKLIF